MAIRYVPLALIILLLIGCSRKEPPRSGGRTAGYWAQVLKEEPNTESRAKAATKLGPLVLIDEEALPALLSALKDNDAAVRMAASRSLGIYSGPKAEEVVPALRELKERDPNNNVREAASKAIDNLLNPKVVDDQ
jgi:HEAT repeat protein